MIAKSERISLRYARPEDAKILFAYTGDIDSSRYLARKPHSNPDQTLKMLTKFSNSESFELLWKCVWVIYLDEINSPIGIITLIKDDSRLEFHFGLLPEYTGKGLASESMSAATRHCCSSKNSNDIVSFTDEQNLAAQAVLINSGFKCVGRKDAFYVAPQISNDRRSVFNYVYCA